MTMNTVLFDLQAAAMAAAASSGSSSSPTEIPEDGMGFSAGDRGYGGCG